MNDRQGNDRSDGNGRARYDDAPALAAFGRFYEIIRVLRGPEGCPWDIEQTADTLKGFLLEEAFECIDSISTGDVTGVREELGDVLLIAVMIAYVYEQSGDFSVSDVLSEIAEKLVRRHPHVFGDAVARDSERVKQQWEEIKVTVEGKQSKTGILDGVKRNLPPLDTAVKLQKKAGKVGFDWKDHAPVFEKVREEIEELERELEHGGAGIEHEIGDLLFSVVNLSRKLHIDPTMALHGANERFRHRFAYIEANLRAEGAQPSAEHLDEMERLWAAAKQIQGDAHR
ncbi:MAG: nucleoside triphosphate pyrophosphohydrolase [Spirochaetaceae bacterium]|nr:MAG: nucleoside triphosphate pyrophosphohydrolase [Spirochaetaceae bacterium]